MKKKLRDLSSKTTGQIILDSKMMESTISSEEKKHIFNRALELAASLCEVKLMDGGEANKVRKDVAKRIRMLKG